MSVTLNKAGYEKALSLIKGGLEVNHDRGNWKAVEPTKDEITRFLDTHTLDEYGLWFLGIDTGIEKNNPARYVYPYGDLQIVHMSAVMAAQAQAQQHGHHDIKEAAHGLLRLLENKK